MRAESTTETVERFAEIWETNSTEEDRLIPELISVANETNRKPDNSYFTERDGLLVDPTSQRPVLEFIAPGVEYDVAKDLQDWAAKSEQGMAVWVSPKLDDIYPCNKALVYQIVYTPNLKKSVRYSAILFDGEIKNPEEYRKTLLTFEDNEDNLESTLIWIEQISGQKINQQQDQNYVRLASYFAQKIKNGEDKKQVVREMKESGFLGSHSVSCPPGMTTFSKYSLENAKIIFISGEKYLKCKCPFCKSQVSAKISSGRIKCPSCLRSAPYKC